MGMALLKRMAAWLSDLRLAIVLLLLLMPESFGLTHGYYEIFVFLSEA